MKLHRVLAVAALATVVCFAVSVAEEPAHEMSPEEKMMMEKWDAYMTPGEPHRRMAKAVGDWVFKTRMWHGPGMAPEESTGTARNEMIMDGRYLVQHAEGTVMGMPFVGHGLTGYDNMKKKYQSLWVDNMGTGVMMSEGTCEGKVCTYYGDSPDVMQGKYKRVRSVAREVSDDEMVFEMYDTAPDGKEWMNFEIVYKRRK